MELQSHTIKPHPKSTVKTKRYGRGNGSQHGSFSGRGIKGQRARSGGKNKNALRGFKQSLQKVPKLKGFTSLNRKNQTVTLRSIERLAQKHDIITPRILRQDGVVASSKHAIKIVGGGTLTKKVIIKGCFASKTCIAAIEKVGGTLQVNL